MHHLIDTAAASTEVLNGLAGEDRAILYRFSLETGMRPGQIAKLTVADFNLTGDPATVTTQAKYVKRRRTHQQILKPALAADLEQRFASKMPTAAAPRHPCDGVAPRCSAATLPRHEPPGSSRARPMKSAPNAADRISWRT
jgi:integrase